MRSPCIYQSIGICIYYHCLRVTVTENACAFASSLHVRLRHILQKVNAITLTLSPVPSNDFLERRLNGRKVVETCGGNDEKHRVMRKMRCSEMLEACNLAFPFTRFEPNTRNFIEIQSKERRDVLQ